jgi:hypothetical protein
LVFSLIDAIFGLSQELASAVTLLIWILGPVIGFVVGARISSSEWGRDWKRRREEKIRRKTGG